MPILIEEMSEHWEIVLFARASDLDDINSPHEKRAIPPQPRSARNLFWRAAYELLGNIPGSKQNYKFWNLRRIAQHKSRLQRIRHNIALIIRLTFANLLSFDSYQSHLDIDDSTQIDDLDVFLCTTDVYDVNFLAHILRSKKPLFTYVYSWDHAGKYHKFLRDSSHYLTWNKGISEDVVELHGIPTNRFVDVGSTQLGLVEKFLLNESNKTPRQVPYRYVYYAAAMGYPEAIEQEIRVVEMLAQELTACDPSVKLRVRPYPHAKALSAYRRLLKLSNVELDNAEIGEHSLVLRPDSHAEKYGKIRDAELLVHMGSTIGLEAAYFNTPVIHLAPEDFEYGYPHADPCHLRHTLNQRHLTKYLLASNEPNVITRKNQLAAVLNTGLTKPEHLLNYNRDLASITALRSIREIATSMGEIMKNDLSLKLETQ